MEQVAVHIPRKWYQLHRVKKRDVVDYLYKKLGNNWCGNSSPPMDHRVYRFDYENERNYKVFSQQNDGHEMWIGHANEWYTHMTLKEFRKVALWTIYHWIFTDWFGLRTKLWYVLLRYKCNQYRRAGKV